MKPWLTSLYYSFPVRLLFFHLRSHHLLLLLWLLFGFLIAGKVGAKLGLQYLFLDPEYLGVVNFWSFFLMGLAFGAFFMTWNLTTYLLCAHLFPFLATLSRPFTKFCLNNLIVPSTLFFFYLGYLIHFQTRYESGGFEYVFLNSMGLVAGTFALILLNFVYFYYTNKDISSFAIPEPLPPNLVKNLAPGRRNVDLDYIKLDQHRLRVDTYLNESFYPRRVRSVAHYEAKMLMNIFKQNHLNALVIQLISMLLLVALGQLIDYPLFRIPAAASTFILASVITAVIGAFVYWFNEWWLTIFIATLLVFNYVTRFDAFNHRNKAYGLDYTSTPAGYSVETLQSIYNADRLEKDIANTLNILERWQQRVAAPGSRKPPMVILCVSGGGLRSATWTMQVMQTADSLLRGKLLDHTVLITGASGGMMGASYLRELYLRRQLGEPIDLYDPRYIDRVGRDLLNPVTFTAVTNDLFLPWGWFKYGGFSYRKDRGYILEKQFNENTEYVLNKKLADYRAPEQQALIPMLYLTPSILNDARRLIISPQGVSFMMMAPVGFQLRKSVEIDAVDFGWLFREQNADSLRMLSAIRMNATYPYVLPTVHLPSKPSIAVVDAGFRDNYGILSATRFIQVFQEWIRANTSGVVLVRISSSGLVDEISGNENRGAISNLLNPLGIASQLIELQEFEQGNSLGFIYDILGKNNFKIVHFSYEPNPINEWRAAVSFHLTAGEKENVLESIHLPDNQNSLRALIEALNR